MRTALQENKDFVAHAKLFTFQNCVQSDILPGSMLPRQNILSSVVSISVSYLTPGMVTVIYPGSLLNRRPFAGPDVQQKALAAILNHVARTTISENIHGAHWLKLIFNLNNTFPALLNKSLYEVYREP